MHLGPLHGEADAAVLGLLHQGLSVHQLPPARVRRPVLGSVHRHLTTTNVKTWRRFVDSSSPHLDDVLQHGAAQSAGDARGGAQRRRGVDLQQPRPSYMSRVTHLLSGVTCHVSIVRCHVSIVRFYVSPEVRGEHEVRPVQLVAVLAGAAAVHHVCCMGI